MTIGLAPCGLTLSAGVLARKSYDAVVSGFSKMNLETTRLYQALVDLGRSLTECEAPDGVMARATLS